MNKTWDDVVQFYFPELGAEERHSVLWACTGYPGFWNIPKDGRSGPECCCHQLSQIARRSGGKYRRAMRLADHITTNAMNRGRDY